MYKPTPLHITIATPFKNRAWCVPAYLDGLLALNHRGIALSLLWIDDASTDDTVALLEDFQTRYAHLFADIVLLKNVVPFADNDSSRDFTGNTRIEGIAHIAEIKNSLLDHPLAHTCDRLFMMESDVLLLPDCLMMLLFASMPLVAPLLYVDNHQRGAINWHIEGNRATNGCYMQENGNAVKLYTGWHTAGVKLLPINCCGGVFLATREALDTGARFGTHDYGDEWPFYVTLREAGMACGIHMTRSAIHVMSPEFLREALEIRDEESVGFTDRVAAMKAIPVPDKPMKEDLLPIPAKGATRGKRTDNPA
jgi:hypothetical protein